MRKGVLLAALALAVAVVGTAVAAFPQDSVKLYTGCLNSGGNITYVKEGDSPLQACASPKQVVKLSGGDITSVTAGTGLSGGGTNGAVTLSLDSAHSLPSGCTSGEVVKSSGSDTWTCAADNDHTYTNGTGLDLSGDTFSIASNYRVTNDQSCTSGKFATGIDSDGNLSCQAPSTGAKAFAAVQSPSTVGIPSDSAFHLVAQLTVGAGSYAVTAIGRTFQSADRVSQMACQLKSGATVAARGGASTDNNLGLDFVGGGSVAIFTVQNLSTVTTLSVLCATGEDGVFAEDFGIQAVSLG